MFSKLAHHSLILLCLLPLAKADVVIPKGAAGWNYLHVTDGIDPATADADFTTTWFHPTTGGYVGGDYDGPAFITEAPAPFHYGVVDGLAGGTELPSVGTGIDRTSYFYLVFDGGDGFGGLELSLLADDGAFVYLNGTLIARDGVDDPDTFQQLAALGDESAYDEIPLLGTPVVQPGANLLAISVHQNTTLSSDLGFDLELRGTPVSSLQIVRGPYLQSGGPDRMTIRWRTDQPGTSVVHYGDAPGNLDSTFILPGSSTEHVATLTGLAPDTTFFYQVETTDGSSTAAAGGDAEHHFSTSPPPGSRKPTRIWVTGDTGTTTAAKQDVYNAYLSRTGAAATDVWLMLGDNAYEDGTDEEFQAALFDAYPELLRKTPLWSCIGNHETVTAAGAPYLDLHTFPTAGEIGGVPSGTERYYSFDHGNIHFIAIDSETAGNYDDAPGNGGMIDWLEDDLQATDKDWIIAYMHHGPYTRGTVDSDSTDHLVEMRHYVVPLLEQYGADLVIYGHSHVYERSMLINGHHSAMSLADSSSTTFDPLLHVVDGGNGSSVGGVDATSNFATDGGDGPYQKPAAAGGAGTVYVTCGASGKLSGWANGSWDSLNPDPHPVFSTGLLAMGSLVIEIDGNTLHAIYIDQWNSLRDDFTIIKGSTIGISAADPDFSEQGPDDTAVFNLTRSGAISFAEDFLYQTGGTSTAGVDFSPALSGTTSFAAGETNRQIVLTRMKDQEAEGPESIGIELVTAATTVAGGNAPRQRYFLAAEASAEATLDDSPSQQWWFESFGAATPGPEEWKLDTDGDGLSRIEELAFGGSEGTNDRDRAPSADREGNRFVMRYFRRPSIPELSVQVQRSADLSAWETDGIEDDPDGPVQPAGTEPWKSSIEASGDAGFLRLRLDLEN
ncbi:MAG: metallophosphoesterase [Akkermansiaceae bacterium]|nr:metallophosphoesterase [Akkermansiaceae bacterium]